MTTQLNFDFFIQGTPAPGGSKKFVGMNKRTGRALIVDAAGKRNKRWRDVCAATAMQYATANGIHPTNWPLDVKMSFHVPRPKSHYRRDGSLKPDAPRFPTTRPDALKLARSTEDALTGIIWDDDATTINLHITKQYAHTRPGCYVYIKSL